MPANDTIHVKAFDMPRLSSLLQVDHRPPQGPRAAEAAPPKERAAPSGAPIAPPPHHDDTNADAIRAYRAWADGEFYPRALAKMRQHYPVTIEAQDTLGVYAELISPETGVSDDNKNRILINLHAGGFTFGARLCGQLESIPIASLGKINVLSVDYRLAPEHKHPAAVEDVLATYRQLLNKHEPGDIGMFGLSAGSLLTAQSIFRFQQEGLPLPGAAAMLFGGATYWGEGDSAHWAAAIPGRKIPPWKDHLYFTDVEAKDPSAFPLHSAEAIAKFPPTLLISGGRDVALSSTIHTHSRLRASGVPAQLMVWEGMGHAFSLDYRLPQSAELYRALVRFFGETLGER